MSDLTDRLDRLENTSRGMLVFLSDMPGLIVNRLGLHKCGGALRRRVAGYLWMYRKQPVCCEAVLGWTAIGLEDGKALSVDYTACPYCGQLFEQPKE